MLPYEVKYQVVYGTAGVQAYSRLAAVLSLLHLNGSAVTALEQLTEIVRKQGQGGGGRDPFKTASRLDEARRGAGRKQPVHHYRLLGLTQACTDAEVRSQPQKLSTLCSLCNPW